MAHDSIAAPRGFASMDADKQREIARKGGANVPHEKRSFAQNRALASEAGRSPQTATWPPERVAREAKRRKANVDVV